MSKTMDFKWMDYAADGDIKGAVALLMPRTETSVNTLTNMVTGFNLGVMYQQAKQFKEDNKS